MSNECISPDEIKWIYERQTKNIAKNGYMELIESPFIAAKAMLF